MAKQVGPIRVDGKLGNFSFYTDAEGNNNVRRKGGPTAKRVKTDPGYARFRQHISEFGLCSRRASAINNGFKGALSYISDAGYFNRLTGLLRAAQETETTSPPGFREPFAGNIYLLEGFQYNRNALVEDIFKADYAVYMDSATGALRLNIASFNPSVDIKAPGRATHFQILARGTSVDTTGADGHCYDTGTPPLPLHNKQIGFLELAVDVPQKDQGILLFGIGIMFYEQQMEVFTPLRGGAFSIVGVERMVGESTADPAALAEINKKARAEANENMMSAIARYQPKKQKRKYDTGPNLYLSPEQQAAHSDMQKKLNQARWLKKADKYRRG